jgi:general secretion pathway protein H
MISQKKIIFRENAGYTMVELAVALVIILIVVSVVAVGVSNIHKSDLSNSAMNVSSAIRYLYSLSVLNNKNYRLVMDMEKGAYWGEELTKMDECTRYLLPSKDEEKPSAVSKPKNTKNPYPKTEESMESDNDSSFQVAKDNLLSKRDLPKKIRFDRVMTSHSPEPFREGRAEIHFWPSGYVEKAYIYIGYEDELYTVETVPLMGIARVHSEELDAGGFYED